MEMQIWRVQMKIEIAEPGRMTQSGSSLLKLIQNNKTPILDLLVRESIQNSLDAHKPNSKAVTVEYRTGNFSSRKLGNELEGITDALARRFSEDKCQYLAVCDSDTVGLTGEMDVQNVKNNNYGNLLKLVYEICKPQEAEGAGGSWGLGKTVYFRIGIGLVIYYSRICDENGNYSSRLAASFVENETSKNAMIPEYKGMTRRGIAWWGETVRENTTIPVTDETYINQFLDIFGLSPYTDDKTGTIIIIPYINHETLLANNRIDYTDAIDEHLSPYWFSTLESYLRISVQRWYAPRLCNIHYSYGPFLKVLINGSGISLDSMEPVFKIVQALYNRAKHFEEDDFLSSNEIETIVEEAKVKKYLNDSIAGNIACAKVTRKVLKMEVPHNKPEPSVYFNCEVTDKSFNRPIIFFVRKPGMIVSYENISAWTAGIPSTANDEYILGIFVLNSLNEFKVEDSPVGSLEEYVRKSEMADHTSWNDWTDSHFNPRIISKIQKSVVKAIGNQYIDDDVEHQTKENSELGRYLGDLVLPPDGFGKVANANPNKPKGGSSKKTQKTFSFSVIPTEIKYFSNKMVVPLELKTSSNKKISRTGFDIQIDTESGKINMNEWQRNLKLETPFFIEDISIYVDTLDGNKTASDIKVDSTNPTASIEDIDFVLKTTSLGTNYGLSINSVSEHSMKIKMITTIALVQKNVRPVFGFEKEGN